MGIISVENTDRLYWLGRYTERTYTTILLFSESFDGLIDGPEDYYTDFCRRLDIPDIYQNAEDFTKHYPYDRTNPDSIVSNLMRAYDNAIVLREELGSETLSYLQLAVYAMNKAAVSDAPLIELQKVEDNLLAFWGIADDTIESENVRNIIKVGKRIERIDLYGRIQMPEKCMRREIHRLTGRIPRTNLAYNKNLLSDLAKMAELPNPDYYRIVEKTDHLLSQ